VLKLERKLSLCMDLLIEGFASGLQAMLSEEFDHMTNIPNACKEGNSWLSGSYSYEIEGLDFKFCRVSRHKRNLTLWINITGPYGIDIRIMTTDEAVRKFLPDLIQLCKLVPDHLNNDDEEWAMKEALHLYAENPSKKHLEGARKIVRTLCQQGEWWEIRDAVENLAIVGNRTDKTLLLKLLNHEEGCVAREAVQTLAKLFGKSAAAPIKALLQDPKSEARAGAARALVISINDKAKPHLTKALQTEEDPQARMSILAALTKLGSTEAKLELMQHLISTDRTTKNIASEALKWADEKVGYNDWEEPNTPPSQTP
jgi:hypothetical protein